MSQNKINAEGNSGLIKRKTKKITAVLLLSGLFIAISYIVLLIPFAIYSVAQISAMLGKRFGFLVMAVVFILMLLLSVLLASPLLFSAALLLLISIPFIMIGVVIREKLLSKNIALFVLFLPFIFGFSCFTFLPVLNTSQFDIVLSQLKQNITNKKQEAQKQVATNISPSSLQIGAKYDEALSQISSLGNIKVVRDFFSYNPWQRIALFVFGPSSLVLFFALLVSFANLVFLDFAYEQVEKIKAIISYVVKNAASFSYEFVFALSQMPMFAAQKIESSFCIVKHDAKPPSSQEQGIKIIRISLFKAPKAANRIFLRGYSFLFEGTLKSWNLRQFAIPLPFALLSILYMAAVMFWFGGSEELVSALAVNTFSPFIALGSLFSFAILSILTLQGFFTFYLCVSNFVGFLFLFILFVLGSNFSIGFYAILAIFGSIALLDYVYDWRGKVSR